MYKRSATVQLKSSASILCNNLDVCKSSGKPAEECKIAVIHKSVVWVFSPKDALCTTPADGVVPFKQVFCKGESSQSCSVILQVCTENTIYASVSTRDKSL